MKKLVFITHPSVEIDPETPIDEWVLSDKGFESIDRLLSMDFISDIDVIYSSTEKKAYTVAEKLSKKLSIDFDESNTRDCLKEINHRIFIPPSRFEEATKRWFDNPKENINGWESRDDTQKRIIDCVTWIMGSEEERTVAIVGHGGTGTLLKCFIKGIEPSQLEDQPGQGCYFSANWNSQELISDWKAF